MVIEIVKSRKEGITVKKRDILRVAKTPRKIDKNLAFDGTSGHLTHFIHSRVVSILDLNSEDLQPVRIIIPCPYFSGSG